MPGCHHAKSVALPSAVVSSGMKPEMTAAMLYANDSAVKRNRPTNMSLIKPPRAAQAAVGRMPPTIIVPTRIGKVANCSR